MDRHLALEAHPGRPLAVEPQTVQVADVGEDAVDRLGAAGTGRQQGHRPAVAEDVQVLAALVPAPAGADRHGQVLGAPGERRDPRRRGQVGEIESPAGGLRRDQDEDDAAQVVTMGKLQLRDEAVHPQHVVDAADLGHDVGVGRVLHRGLDVLAAPTAHQVVDPHRALLAAEVRRLQPVGDFAANLLLAVGRHRVLEIEDQRVRIETQGLGQHSLVAAGDEMDGAPETGAAHEATPSPISSSTRRRPSANASGSTPRPKRR